MSPYLTCYIIPLPWNVTIPPPLTCYCFSWHFPVSPPLMCDPTSPTGDSTPSPDMLHCSIFPRRYFFNTPLPWYVTVSPLWQCLTSVTIYVTLMYIVRRAWLHMRAHYSRKSSTIVSTYVHWQGIRFSGWFCIFVANWCTVVSGDLINWTLTVQLMWKSL